MYTYIRARIGELDLHISALCMFAYLYICKSSILVVASYFDLNTIVAGIIIAGFAGAFLVYTFANPDKICIDGIILVAAAILFFYVTLLIHPEYLSRYRDLAHDGSHSAWRIFSFGGPIYAYYFIRLFREEEAKLISLMKAIAYTILLCDSWAIFSDKTPHREGFEYSMTLGYQMALGAILFLSFYFYENNLTYLVLSLICMVVVVVCGSRASVVGIVVFLALYYMWKREIGVKQLLMIFVAVAGVIVYKSPKIVWALYKLFSAVGLRSRTLYYIAGGDILATDRSRQRTIWPSMVIKMKEMSIFKGYGAYGDRYYLSDEFVYAHNIFLEVILSFGFIIGGALLIWIIYQFARVILKNRDIYGLITIAWGSFSLGRLMFSSTIWEEMSFWIFIAMLVNCAIRRKRGIVTEEPDT